MGADKARLCAGGSCAQAVRLNGWAIWPPVLPSGDESSPSVTSVSEATCQAKPRTWTFRGAQDTGSSQG